MQSLSKLGAGQEKYYIGLARGIEDYYLGRGEVPGHWLGAGTTALGLEGEVSAEALGAVLGGRDPQTGRRVVPANRRVPGFDSTFSAPKSVSLLYALGEPAVRGQVVEAHDRAVEAAVGYLEQQAAYVRRGHNGVERLPASGFVAAAFRHRTSRAGDPQLHTHVLIANVAQAGDGRSGALDGRGLYAHKMDGGAIYQAQLRAELTRRLGVEWGPVNNGPAEIAGVPREVIREFSRRRGEIEAALAARGASSARAAEVANLATRRPKANGVDVTSLYAEWAERAEAIGFDAERVAALTGAGRRPDSIRMLRGRLADELTAHKSVFDRRDVVRAVCNAARTGGDVADVEATADDFLRSIDVVRLRKDPVLGQRYTTQQILRLEREVLGHCKRSRDAAVAVVPAALATSELRARPSLGRDQRRMVEALTTSGAAVDVVVGPAGTGKTFALDAARATWQAVGYRVVGASLAARAAAELEAGSGIPSFTMASLLGHLQAGRLPARSVIVVDEAGMVGTRQLAMLIRHARGAAAKVVLVGDPHQLPEIDAGGIFGALARGERAIHLTDDRRHRDAHEHRALADLRAGRVADAVGRLARHGRITTGDNADVLRERLVADWHETVQSGHVGLMLARRRCDVADLNRRARDALFGSGYLDRRRERGIGGLRLCEGDWVVAGRNDRRLGVLNGDLGVVTAASAERVAVKLDRGPTVELPADYVAEHLRHGYALTIHKAQGATCDATFVLGGETLGRESGYTAMSRGRNRNQLYVMNVPDDHGIEPHGRSLGREFDLVETLRRSEAQVPAHDVGFEL